MLNPVGATAGWLSGRLFLFVVILVCLVAWDAYRDESALLTAQLKSLVPDQESVQRLEAGRARLASFARAGARRVDERLAGMGERPAREIDARIAQLAMEIARKESGRRSQSQKLLSMLSGSGFEQDLELEIDLQLLVAERQALRKLRDQLSARGTEIVDLARRVRDVAFETRAACDAYYAARREGAAYAAAYPILGHVPLTPHSRRLQQMQAREARFARACVQGGRDLKQAQARLAGARARRAAVVAEVAAATHSILGPLDQIVTSRRDALEASRLQAQKIQRSIQKVFLHALGILVVVTLVPVCVKAFWYWCIAPLAERRPPIRVGRRSSTVHAVTTPQPSLAGEKISAVSQLVQLDERHELLVHPEFLQSVAGNGRATTQWLMSWRFPLTSIAARMVALTRIRAPSRGEFVVSSQRDPLVEVGSLHLADGEALVLQPRYLVGLVQPIDRPIQIRRRWVCNLGALITLQFRYLIFEGPGHLLVQGCRGVRVEPAGSGRRIDQDATMGFGADLDYRPRRSETFGAYLLGLNGLFDDAFEGPVGYCVYEEMPHWGTKSGITGRGLEGLTDGILKVVGV